ncbi:MAG: hypothetical protein P8X76_16935, partial [Maritimibacter sp.]
MKQRLLASLGKTAVLRILSIFLATAISGYLTRTLDKGSFAAFGGLLALSAILSGLQLMGGQVMVARLAAERRAEERLGALKGDVAQAIVLTLPPTLLIISASFFLGPNAFGISLAGENYRLIWIASAVFFVFLGWNILFAEALRGLDRPAMAVLMTGLGQQGGALRAFVLGGLLVSVGAFGTTTLASTMTLMAVSSIFSTIATLMLLRWLLHPHGVEPFSLVPDCTKRVASYTLLVGTLLQTLVNGSAAIIAANFAGIGNQLAFLIVALQLGNFLQAPQTLVNGVLPAPIIEASRSSDRDALQLLLRFASSLVFWATLVVVALIATNGRTVFGMIYGAEYAAAARPFMILAAGYLVNAYMGSSARSLMLLGKEQAHAHASMAIASIALPAYYVAALWFGVDGLALAISLVLVLQNLAYF